MKHERGVAYHWLNKFDDAINDFKDAEKIFRKLGGHRYRFAWELNWLGYSCYRHGNFKEAEKYLTKSIKEFLRHGRKKDGNLFDSWCG